MSDVELADLQMELGGVVIGRPAPVRVQEVSGLGRPPLRDTSTIANPTGDGAYAGVDYYDARTIKIDCAVRIPGDPAACRAVVAALQAAADDPSVRLAGGVIQILRIKWPGSPTKAFYGRLAKVDPTWAQLLNGWVPLDLEFTATDPRPYGDVDRAITMPLAVLGSGGFTAPVVAPIVVGGGGSSTRPGWVVNAGDAPTWPRFVIAGPCSNPVVTQVETARVIALNGTIPAGQSITVDTRPGQRSVTWNSGADASTLLTAQSRIDLMQLPAGTGEIRWTAVDPTNTSRLSVVWRDAYIAL